ncbi:hypothetical protein J437_LFUL019242 [Ladona fulva]|uniref:Reverse transcriptase domain-containing protein n=1 Tax=Ladona fulva TaxID=123851 RepID=A0A8K0KSW2_LADFU|nr:hypothetical protein J437_LFUL019242 [Ladona fulva]
MVLATIRRSIHRTKEISRRRTRQQSGGLIGFHSRPHPPYGWEETKSSTPTRAPAPTTPTKSLEACVGFTVTSAPATPATTTTAPSTAQATSASATLPSSTTAEEKKEECGSAPSPAPWRPPVGAPIPPQYGRSYTKGTSTPTRKSASGTAPRAAPVDDGPVDMGPTQWGQEQQLPDDLGAREVVAPVRQPGRVGAPRAAGDRLVMELPEAILPRRIPAPPTTTEEPTDDQMLWLIQIGTLETGHITSLEGIVGEISRVAADLTNAKARSTAPRRRKAISARPAAELQHLYRIDKRRAFKAVTEAPSPDCPIAMPHLSLHFNTPPPSLKDGPPPSTIPEITIIRVPGEEEKLLCPISPAEVLHRLQRCRNTTPGPDGIPYRAWRREEQIPREWKKSRTVLLHKGGEEDDIGNWRPIALQPTLGKIFAGILADRIHEWSMRGRRISSPFQKGFIPGTEGCFEHKFVLNSALEDASRNSKELAIAWLDFADAFGSISHAHITRTLIDMAMPNTIVRLIASMYEGVSTRIEADSGTTPPVEVTKGVRQGDPLSPLLFNLAIESMLRAALARRTTAGYAVGPTRWCLLAYADDIILLAHSAGALNTLIHAISTAATWSGLQFKPRKWRPYPHRPPGLQYKQGSPLPTGHVRDRHITPACQSSIGTPLPIFELLPSSPLGTALLLTPSALLPPSPSAPPSAPPPVPPPAFRTSPSFFPLMEGESYRYLGAPKGWKADETPTEVLRAFQRDLATVNCSNLAPWQRLDAIRTFLLPRLDFHLRIPDFPKSAL